MTAHDWALLFLGMCIGLSIGRLFMWLIYEK
jgi:hypothetical protein